MSERYVQIRVRFPEALYSPGKGAMLELAGMGSGGTTPIALKRALENVLRQPQMFHKSPQMMYITLGVNEPAPLFMYVQSMALGEAREQAPPDLQAKMSELEADCQRYKKRSEDLMLCYNSATVEVEWTKRLLKEAEKEVRRLTKLARQAQGNK